ncbi:MAG TPA: DMT family transporter [Anaerolineales bacterium]|nr:DMT family transporter [Anaerolineales bacterium]
METKNPNRSVMIAFALAVFFAGNNAIAVRYSNMELPPFFGAAIRFSIAGIILFALVAILRLPLPRGKGLLGAVLFGVLGSGLNFALMYWALETLHPGLSMVILALVPLLTFLLACVQKQEVFRWQALLGSLLALGGIGVIVSSQLGAKAPLLPMLAVVGAAACFAESNIVIKAFPQSHPITTNAIALSVGSVLLFILSAIWHETPHMPTLATTWAALIFLIIIGSVVVFSLTVYVVKNWTASASAYQFVLFPIITISVSAWLTKEQVSIALILGALLVLAGVYIGGIAKSFNFSKISLPFITRKKAPSPDC